jgi:hypothetical protein
MSESAGNSGEFEVVGTIRFNELEGGFWVLELDESHDDLGMQVVLQGFAPGPDSPADVADGSHVCARVRVREEQFGFQMAGTMVDVLELTPLPA